MCISGLTPEGHNVNKKYSYWFDQYNALPAKPILEDEANYELLGSARHILCNDQVVTVLQRTTVTWSTAPAG